MARGSEKWFAAVPFISKINVGDLGKVIVKDAERALEKPVVGAEVNVFEMSQLMDAAAEGGRAP